VFTETHGARHSTLLTCPVVVCLRVAAHKIMLTAPAAASIKLQRAPNLCVYFDSSPQGVTAAHNCTLKAVAVQVCW
jgi:hypothetical protein